DRGAHRGPRHHVPPHRQAEPRVPARGGPHALPHRRAPVAFPTRTFNPPVERPHATHPTNRPASWQPSPPTTTTPPPCPAPPTAAPTPPSAPSWPTAPRCPTPRSRPTASWTGARSAPAPRRPTRSA